MTALQQAGLPGQDFVLRACNARCNGFTTAIGEYRHAQATMRSLLCLQPFGLTKQMASTYGLHGFRHVYTTAMRQLDLPPADIDDAGHWRRGSEMIRTYDSESCVHELVAKEKVRAAVEAGWRRVSAACLPRPAPATPAQPVVQLPSSSPSSSSSSWQVPPVPALHVKEDTYVMHLATDTVHVWQGMTRRGELSSHTRCRNHRCGTPSAQSKLFMWAAFQPLQYVRCRRCFAASEPK